MSAPVWMRALCSTLVVLTAVRPAVAQRQEPSHASASNLRFLTKEPGAIDYWPCFSPDGKTVLFSRSTDRGKTWDLFVVPTSGGDVRPLSRTPLPVSATRPNWSRQTDLIAFTGIPSDSKNAVWVISSAGTQARQLDYPGLSDQVFYPSWFPGGHELAVIDYAAGVLKRIDLARRFVAAVTSRAQVLSGMPNVSPDGQWIAFAGQKNVGQEYDQKKNSIWVVRSTGEQLRTLEPTPQQGRTPAWSSDGRWVVFESDRGNDRGQHAVFAVKRDGNELVRLTPYEWNANHPVCSPVGKRMVFSAIYDAKVNAPGIAIMDVRGGWCGSK
jgi:Tol biopolymer transport system component